MNLNSTKNTRPLQIAKRLSYKSQHRCRIGAVIMNGKTVVGLGFNKHRKTHPKITSRSHWKHIHAELDAIIGAQQNLLEGSTIYVFRELRNGQIGLCKPCIDCQAILKEVGIKKAIYTDPSLPHNLGLLVL